MGVIDFGSFNPPTNTHVPANRKGNARTKIVGKRFNKKIPDKVIENKNFDPNKTLVSNKTPDQRISFGNSFRKYNEKDEFTKHHSHDMNKKRAFGPAKSNFAQKRFNKGSN